MLFARQPFYSVNNSKINNGTDQFSYFLKTGNKNAWVYNKKVNEFIL